MNTLPINSRAEGRIGCHELRHTYATCLVMRGTPLKVVQELHGHATIEMTMKYAHLRPERWVLLNPPLLPQGWCGPTAERPC